MTKMRCVAAITRGEYLERLKATAIMSLITVSDSPMLSCLFLLHCSSKKKVNKLAVKMKMAPTDGATFNAEDEDLFVGGSKTRRLAVVGNNGRHQEFIDSHLMSAERRRGRYLGGCRFDISNN